MPDEAIERRRPPGARLSRLAAKLFEFRAPLIPEHGHQRQDEVRLAKLFALAVDPDEDFGDLFLVDARCKLEGRHRETGEAVQPSDCRFYLPGFLQRKLTGGRKAGDESICKFVDEELIPWEVEAEMNGGLLPEKVRARHRRLMRRHSRGDIMSLVLGYMNEPRRASELRGAFLNGRK